MASIDGIRLDIIGASGSQGLLTPKSGWRLYVFPQGGFASQSSSGTLITFDSSAVASRFAVNNWIEVGLSTDNIRQVSGVGGNSVSVSGSALTVALNDRVFLIGNTQPTVTGGSATYTTPATQIFQRDDDGSTLYTNSMVTTNSDGMGQFFSQPNRFDVLIQDGNQANQGSIVDLLVGTSLGTVSVFGATVTINAALGVTGVATFGSTVTMNAALGVTGWATFGSTVTMHAALGVTGYATFGSTITGHANFGVTGSATIGGTATVTGQAVLNGGATVTGGVTVSTGAFGVSNQPRVVLFNTSGTTIAGGGAAGTTTTVTWDSESLDVGDLHAAGSTSSRITIPAGSGGLYWTSFLLETSQMTGSFASCRVAIRKNGATLLALQDQVINAGTNESDMQVSVIDQAVSNDFYEALARIVSGTTTMLTGGSGHSKFMAVKVC